MSVVSHLIAFSFGGVCSILAVIALFYWVLLKRIQKNEGIFAEPVYKQVEPAGDPFSGLHRINSFETSNDERNSKESLSPSPLTIASSSESKKQQQSTAQAATDKESKKDHEQANARSSQDKKDKQSKPVDPIQKAIQNKLSTNSTPSKSVPSNSSTTPSTPNPKTGIPHLTVSTPGTLNLTQSIDEPLKMGWVKMRGFHVWWNRWAVLRPGKILTTKKEDCFGILLLNGCEVQNESRKGFCFKVSHPEAKNIYSYKGLKGETLTSAKFPGSTDHCVIAVATEQDRAEWMTSIQAAIEKASLEHPEQPSGLLSPTETRPLSSLSIDKEPISRSSSSSDLKKVEETDLTPKVLDNVASDLASQDFEIPEDDKDDSESNFSLGKTSDHAADISKAEDKDSSKIFSDPSSDEEDEDGKIKSHFSASLEDLKSPPSPEVRQPTSDKKEMDIQQQVQLEKKLEQVQEITRKEEEISPLLDTKHHSVDKEKVEAEEIKTHVHYYKEGTAQLRTPKAWREFFLIIKNGLLLYYDSDKSSDSDGLVDLEGCKVIMRETEKSIDIAHPLKKRVHYIINSPDSAESKRDFPSEYDVIRLRTDSLMETQEWMKVIEQAALSYPHHPIILPRYTSLNSISEKCHWFNVFMNRYFKDMENSEVLSTMFKGILIRKFEKIKKPDFIGDISLEHLDLGNQMINIKEISIVPSQVPNELIGEADIDYAGGASLTISTEFYVNWPTHHFATVPVVCFVRLKSMAGRIHIYGPPEIYSRFSLSFLELPKCEFDVNLKVGNKQKQYDVSKISKVSDFFISVLKRLLWKNTVQPNRITFSLPLPGKKLQPRTTQLTSRTKQQLREEELECKNNSGVL